MKEFVLSFKEKITQPCFTYFQIAGKYQTSFKTNPLNIIFDDFSIWLSGYTTEFICLYLPQGHNFISTAVWLWSSDEYVNFWFWA